MALPQSECEAVVNCDWLVMVCLLCVHKAFAPRDLRSWRKLKSESWTTDSVKLTFQDSRKSHFNGIIVLTWSAYWRNSYEISEKKLSNYNWENELIKCGGDRNPSIKKIWETKWNIWEDKFKLSEREWADKMWWS